MILLVAYTHGVATLIRLWLWVFIALMTLTAIACGNDDVRYPPVRVSAEGSKGSAPAFTGETFSHGDFSLNMYTERPILVNFWFPSCPPCRAEMPDLQVTYEKYDDKVIFIGVQQLGLDSASDGAVFIKELGITYPSMPDVGSTVQASYEVFSFPTTVFIDRDHDIARVWTGIINKEQIEQQLDALIARKP